MYYPTIRGCPVEVVVNWEERSVVVKADGAVVLELHGSAVLVRESGSPDFNVSGKNSREATEEREKYAQGKDDGVARSSPVTATRATVAR